MRHVAVIPALLLLSACGARYLQSPVIDPQTEIRRTSDGEAIVALVEEYARAVDALDITSLRALVSEEYYENAGTTDTTRDDYGFGGVELLFATLSEHVDDVDVDIAVRDLVVDGDAADVLYEYTFRMRYTVAEETHWETARDVNRLQLQREPDGWRIIGGL